MEKYVHRRSDRHLPPASLIVFAALLCGFALVNLFWPKRENSELENRKLAQMPVFSVKTLLNGKWQDDFSTYLQDQVALRDGWINLESTVNALAFGKTEESGILNGKDGWMFTKLFTVSTDTEKQLGKNQCRHKLCPALPRPGHFFAGTFGQRYLPGNAAGQCPHGGRRCHAG